MNTSMTVIVSIIAHLVAGNGVRQTAKLLGISKDTVMRWALLVGIGCERLLDRYLRDLHVRRLELDELHSHIHTRQRHLHAKSPAEAGDIWGFIAEDPDSRAIVMYALGKRQLGTTQFFIRELRKRILGRPSIATDGYSAYLTAIARWFGDGADYTQIVKAYESGRSIHGLPAADRFVSAKRMAMLGKPDTSKASTSHVERLNLTVRSRLAKFSRRTSRNGKCLRNLQADFAIFVATYNFVDVHGTTKLTPANLLRITDRPWSLMELIQAALAEPDPCPVTAALAASGVDGSNLEVAAAPSCTSTALAADDPEASDDSSKTRPLVEQAELSSEMALPSSREKSFVRRFPAASVSLWGCAADAAGLKLKSWICRTLKDARPLDVYRPFRRGVKMKWLGIMLQTDFLEGCKAAARIAGTKQTTWVRCQLDEAAIQQLVSTKSLDAVR